MNVVERMIILRNGETMDGVDCLTAPEDLGGGQSCEVENGEFYRGFCKRMKFSRVLHTGTHKGYDVSWMAMGLEENGIYPHKLGKIITVDVNDYGASELWDKLELKNITQVIGDSKLPETYKPHIDASVQWVHCDADHSAESLIAEFECVLPHMDTMACVFSCHDSRLDRRLSSGIREIIHRLKVMRDLDHGWKHISHFPIRNLRGIDFIQLSNEEF